MFTNTEAEKAVIQQILDYQEKRGTTSVRLYTAANMTYPTWKTRLRGETSFNIRELLAIADVLGITLADLTEGTQSHSEVRAA